MTYCDLNMTTEEEIKIRDYIRITWPKFRIEVGIKLSVLFPEPENVGLKNIWKYGHADISIYRRERFICLIEPGGSHHFENKQSLNDRRKWKLAEINNVRCVHLLNGLLERLSKRQFRKIIGGVLYGKSTNKD